jgi:hypothetical protein
MIEQLKGFLEMSKYSNVGAQVQVINIYLPHPSTLSLTK